MQGNRDFFLNTVSWLAEQEDQITLRPKENRSNPVFLSSRQEQFVRWVPPVVLPALVLIIGIATLVRRRAAN